MSKKAKRRRSVAAPPVLESPGPAGEAKSSDAPHPPPLPPPPCGLTREEVERYHRDDMCKVVDGKCDNWTRRDGIDVRCGRPLGAHPSESAALGPPNPPTDIPEWLEKFWLDCCNSETTISEDNSVITLKNSYWERRSGMKSLYVRGCYTAISDSIKANSRSHVLVRGTPGIGKSAFLYYLIYYYVQENPAVNISFCLTYLNGEVKEKWYLSRIDNIPCVTEHLNGGGRPDYYFSDSVDIEAYDTAKTLTILFASIDARHYKAFAKVQQSPLQPVNAWDTYMPLVKFEELRFMVPRDVTISDESLQFYYDIYGGSARNCLDRGVHAAVAAETTAIIVETLELFFPDISETAKTWALNTLGSHIDKLIKEEGSPNQLKRSVFQHVFVDDTTFGESSTSFCSKFMKYLCGRVLMNKEQTLRDRIIALFGNPGEGIMFEAMAFDTIFKNLNEGKQYYMRKIGEEVNETKILKRDGDVPLRKVLIRKIADIETLRNGDIGVPVVGNFPLIDFVIKNPPTFLQMTIKPKHRGALDKLSDIQSAMNGNDASDSPIMLFVTRQENIRDFMCGLEGIQQYVMCPELTATPDVVSSGKKRRAAKPSSDQKAKKQKSCL